MECDKKHRAGTSKLKVGDTVYMKARQKNSGLDCVHWLGPYEFVEIVSNENVRVKMSESKRHSVVNINRLKPDKSDKITEVNKLFTKVLDKMRTMKEKGRLQTKYFVQLEKGEALWVSDDFIDQKLTEVFNKV